MFEKHLVHYNRGSEYQYVTPPKTSKTAEDLFMTAEDFRGITSSIFVTIIANDMK